MRFDEFVTGHGIAVVPVDQFDGLVVEVGVPPGWELVISAVGTRVGVCRDERPAGEFCANAVLTMHHVEAALDPGEVFAMLADQQVHSVPGCREHHRELAQASEEAGVVGLLTVQILNELGTIDSTTWTRIITADQQTMIAQLTLTALQDSSVNRAEIWLTARSGAAPGPASAGHHRGVPHAVPRDNP